MFATYVGEILKPHTGDANPIGQPTVSLMIAAASQIIT